MLLVAYPFAPVGRDAIGGAEQVVAMLDRALPESGHCSVLVACSGSRSSGRLLAHDLPAGAIDERSKAATYAAVRAHIADVLKSAPVDLVHLHGLDFANYLPPPGRPCLVTLHLPPAWHAAADFSPSRPHTWLHGVSEAQHRACPPGANLLPPIGNGVPVRALSASRHARRSFVVMLGRICPEKGQHLALDAAHAAGVPLLIGGAVFPYAAHQAYFDTEVAPRLDSRRRWLGPVGFARKRRLLSAARCLLAPSLAEETSSLVAMEALACGTPVIAFAAGALPSLVEHGRTGFIVHNATEMAEAIRRVGEIDGAVCRQVALERFDEKRTVDAYLERYRLLIGRPAAAA